VKGRPETATLLRNWVEGWGKQVEVACTKDRRGFSMKEYTTREGWGIDPRVLEKRGRLEKKGRTSN